MQQINCYQQRIRTCKGRREKIKPSIYACRQNITLTSPKAPLPIMVRRSKSSTQILCLLRRIYSVSLRSRSFNRLICSSSGTRSEANFFSSTERLNMVKSWERERERYLDQTLNRNFIVWSLLISLQQCVRMWQIVQVYTFFYKKHKFFFSFLEWNKQNLVAGMRKARIRNNPDAQIFMWKCPQTSKTNIK